MLEDLDNVDWGKLDFPELPKLIRDLTSSDNKIREHAYDELYDKGLSDLPRAAPYVVPFLIELLNQNNIKQKETILLLLMQMASQATAYLYVASSPAFFQSVLDEIAKGVKVYERFVGDIKIAEVTNQLLDSVQSSTNPTGS